MSDDVHFDGRRFFNPRGATGQPLSAVPRMLRTPRVPWPVSLPIVPRRPPPLDGAAIAATFIGHSTFLIQTAFGHVLTDPMFSERASPLPFAGPRRVRLPAVALDDLPPIAMVLLSHNHYDHCDLPSLRAIERRHRPIVVTPLGNRRLLASAGVRRIRELDWWEHADDLPLPVAATPAQHFSARTPFDRNRALWSGFVLTVGSRRVFFGGDSGYGAHFGAIPHRCGAIDLAMLPIGAYEPRWFMRDIHMDPDEAVQAHLDLAAARSVAMHFATFPLTPEGIDEPETRLAAALGSRGLAADAFVALEFGDSIRIQP